MDDVSDLLQEAYKALKKTKEEIFTFIKDARPTFIEPYRDYWNLFAGQFNMPAIKTINKARRVKFRARIQEKGFDFLRVITKASKSSRILGGTWFSFDWIMQNDNNYLKVLEGNYDNKAPQHNEHTQQPPAGQSSADALEESIIAAADLRKNTASG